MWRCPPASGTPFIGRPRAKKKSRGPTEEGRPKQNFLVYPRTPPHRQADAIMSAASSTLERDPELIDAKAAEDDLEDIAEVLIGEFVGIRLDIGDDHSSKALALLVELLEAQQHADEDLIRQHA